MDQFELFLKHFFPILFSLIFCTASWSQEVSFSEMDAIDSALVNPTLSESEKVTAVLDAIKNITVYDRANVQLKQTLKLAEKNEMQEAQYKLLYVIARYSIFLQEFDSLYVYGNRCMDFLKETGEIERIGNPLGLIMSGYYYQDRYQEAIDLFNENRHYFQGNKMNKEQSNLYYSAAINFELIDQVDSSIYYLELIVEDPELEISFDERMNITGVLLAIYSEYGRKTKANDLIGDLLKMKEETVDTSNLISVSSSIGKHFQYNGDYPAAKKYVHEALDMSIKKGLSTEMKRLYYNLYEIEKSMGQEGKALATLENYLELKDSLNNVQIKIATQEFEEKYQNDRLIIENLTKETALKEAENIRIKTEAEAAQNGRNFIFALLGMILLVVIASFWIVLIRNRRKKEGLQAQLTKEAIERDLAENQLKALRSQMNPHFVFNAINSIQGLILDQDTEKSYHYLIQFSQLVRKTLEYSKQESITLEEEIEYLRLYLSLESLRFNEQFSYQITNEVSTPQLLPSILLQPFVENAIKHGLFHKKGNKNLDIIFYKKEHLICEIIDNGIGREKADEIKQRGARKHNSFSTEAIALRMEILSEKYEGEVFYEIIDCYTNDNIPSGTKVVIHLPNIEC